MDSTEYWWDIFLSQQMLAVIKHAVDDNIICFSATQLMFTPAHGASNTIQQLLRITLSMFFSLLSYGPNRTELNSIY